MGTCSAVPGLTLRTSPLPVPTRTGSGGPDRRVSFVVQWLLAPDSVDMAASTDRVITALLADLTGSRT